MKYLKIIALGFCILTIGLSISFLKGNTSANVLSQIQELSQKPTVEELFDYGFKIKSSDSLEVITKKIRRNETLYSILRNYEVPLSVIHLVTKNTKKVFNHKNLAVNNNYHVYLTDDTSKTAKYFVYEYDLRNFVTISLKDSIYVDSGQRESYYEEERASGKVKTSLYASLMEKDLSPSLAYDIAEIFAWQVDFYRIRKGDAYHLILEREYIDGKPTGLEIVKAAKFIQKGKPYYAFRFEDNNRFRYFDEEGNSLQRTFLKAPLKYSRVSSRYTRKRFHPVLKRYKAHLGTDYVAPKGTPVYAVADGVIRRAGYTKNNGNYVRIKHNSVYETGYLHFSKIASGIKTGMTVKQGQVIGYVGDTGLASGVHLCYRLWKYGRQVDPYKQKNPAAKPIENEHQVRFLTYMNLTKVELDQMDMDSESKNLLAAN